MRCDACGSGDSLLVVVRENSRKETMLCRVCAMEKGYRPDEGVATVSQQDSALDDVDQINKTGEIIASCPSCGMEPELLMESGRLGCPYCVQAFKRQYILARKRRGLPVGYAGKVPRSFATDLEGLGTVPSVNSLAGQGAYQFPGSNEGSQLLADMESAVLAEDFEKAAFLRDRLGSARINGKPENDA